MDDGVLQRGQVDGAQVSIDPDHGRQSGGEMQVGSLVLDTEGKQLGDVHSIILDESEAVRLKAILNDLALSGRFDVLRFDAHRLIGIGSDPYQRLNATYTPMTLRAAGPRGPRVECRLG